MYVELLNFMRRLREKLRLVSHLRTTEAWTLFRLCLHWLLDQTDYFCKNWNRNTEVCNFQNTKMHWNDECWFTWTKLGWWRRLASQRWCWFEGPAEYWWQTCFYLKTCCLNCRTWSGAMRNGQRSNLLPLLSWPLAAWCQVMMCFCIECYWLVPFLFILRKGILNIDYVSRSSK